MEGLSRAEYRSYSRTKDDERAQIDSRSVQEQLLEAARPENGSPSGKEVEEE